MTSMQRGFAAVKAGNAADAAKWFEIALDENPKDAQARAWLGQALCSIGRRVDGTVHLRQAGLDFLEDARRSKNISLVLEIVGQLQHWSDFPGALELLREVVILAPAEFKGFQLLAVTYAQLNRKNEAIDAGEQALKLAPDNVMMQVFLGSLEADAGKNTAAKERLGRVVAGQPATREAFRAHKELARVNDKLQQYEEVFPHLHRAGSLSRSLPEYAQQDAALIPNMLKTNRARFNRQLLGRWATAEFPRDQAAPTFVIGFMRSGTTLTQEVLDVHPGVFVSDEVDFVTQMKEELCHIVKSGMTIAEKLAALDFSGVLQLRAYYWQCVQEHFGDVIGQRLFVDKFTMNTVDLGLINCIFPDAKVVFVMRDPRDVCLSCFMQLMVPTPTTVQMLNWASTAAFYGQVMDWWLYIKEQMTLDFIEFRYEDVVADFETTYRKVFDFLGLSWDPAVVNFHNHAAKKFVASPRRTQLAQPLYASSVGKWRCFESAFEPVKTMLSPYVRAFNYPPF